MDKMKITNNINYHIYILNKNETDNIIKNKDNYICFFQKNNSVKSGDIILIYQKERLSSGFACVVQLQTDVIYNDKNLVKVSSDKNMNRFYAKVNFKKIFVELIKTDEIIKFLSSDATGFKNAASFKRKYTSKTNALIGFDVYGKKILTRIFLQDDENFIKSSNLEEESDSNLEEEGSEDNQDNLEEESDDNLEKEGSEDNQEDLEESQKENSQDSLEEQDNNPGFIPIMVVPCKEFKMPKKNKESYFLDHYMTCTKCDITNNNKNSELARIINKKNIEIFEINSNKHYYFNPAISAYHELSNYEPPEVKKRPFCRVIHINNGDEDYDGCYLVTLCT